MSMSDIEKLRVLLPHWLEHNTAYADDYRAWAERAQAAGAARRRAPDRGQCAASFRIEKLEGVNRDLAAALEHLGGSAEAAGHDYPHEQHDHVH